MHCINTWRGVIRHRSVSDSSDTACPLQWGQSAQTEYRFADVGGLCVATGPATIVLMHHTANNWAYTCVIDE